MSENEKALIKCAEDVLQATSMPMKHLVERLEDLRLAVERAREDERLGNNGDPLREFSDDVGRYI